MIKSLFTNTDYNKRFLKILETGADLVGGCWWCAPPSPPPPRDDLRFSNTAGILQKNKTMWFIGVEVEQETSAPPPKKKGIQSTMIFKKHGSLKIKLLEISFYV